MLEWDFSLTATNPEPNTNYCFRLSHEINGAFLAYESYPAVFTTGPPVAPTLLIYFDNERTADTTPELEFVADLSGEEINYQVQIDTDFNFGSPFVDSESSSDFLKFENLSNTSDKAPLYWC